MTTTKQSAAKTKQSATTTDQIAHETTGVWGADVASGARQFLQPLVVNLTALHVEGKQAHWHVRGSGFIGVHELLDLYVAHVREWADLVAERVVALGLPVDGRIRTVGKDTVIPQLKDGFQSVPDTIAQVIEQIDATLKVLHESMDELEDIDVASQDVLVEIERGLVKDRWFLHAHIAED
ncbi:Dps family protein [Naasia aerilata]|uniref:DNA starvation/stationary phase protection protein n=1 Tax=Naasia aerilata TaxID=1162966 RepID=A0ABN6XNG4_9MICO|nr:DNA starvation/stationary phase protection protein [Naasia aerilata]BDZ46498.1 DNA starvation/stationary phase protection protein [Naasia aerilata]